MRLLEGLERARCTFNFFAKARLLWGFCAISSQVDFG